MRKILEDALSRFGDRIGLSLTLGQEGSLSIALDEIEIGIRMDADETEVMFFGIVGALPDDAPTAFHRMLMAANSQAALTDGGCLGYDLDDETVTLTRVHPIAWITGTTLEDAVDRFANTLQGWQTALRELERLGNMPSETTPAMGVQGGEPSWIKL